MAHPLSLAHPSLIDCPPAEMARLAGAAGFDRAGQATAAMKAEAG